MSVLCLFLAVLWVGLQYVIVAIHGHIHLLCVVTKLRIIFIVTTKVLFPADDLTRIF